MGTLGRTGKRGQNKFPGMRRTGEPYQSHPAVAKLAVALREQKEAREQQAATAEILKVIARSPADAQPVFDTICRSAVRLCGSLFGAVYRFDGEKLHFAAHHNFPPAALKIVRESYPKKPDRSQGSGRAILTKSSVCIEDTLHDREYRRAFGRGRWRRVLAVPMMREGKPLGTVSVAWADPGPIPPSQVALLKTFADQAVIAIENARLFKETQEALDHQKASSDILRIVASSVESTDPVFTAITEAGKRLLPGMRVAMAIVRDGELHYVSHSGVSTKRRALVAKFFPMPIDNESVIGAAVAGKRTVIVPDIEAAGVPFKRSHQTSRAAGWKGMMAVPLMRDAEAIGVLSVTRSSTGPFSDTQIALARTFADQAVIAIQNARLFNETKAALERQTATGEILSSISGSITDARPVFDAIASNVRRLFGTRFAAVQLLRDGQIHLVAAKGDSGFERMAEGYPQPLNRATLSGMAMLEGTVQQVCPVSRDPAAPATSVEHARKFGGYEALISAPMMRDGKVIGAIATARREAIPFDDKQVALIKSFADQAVIAIENARLFNETKEALERQTATAEILQVIGSSPTDTQPVFDAIVNSGVRLFPGAMITVARPSGGTVQAAAIAHEDTTMVAGWKERFTTPLSRDRLHAAAILDAKLIDIPDAEAEKDGPLGPGVRNFLLSGNRAVTIMPMLRGEGAIGAISVTRRVPGPLSDKQISILRTFADQAVIAIENVRLFNETKEALERQTATAEILNVISRSPTDVQPVLDAVADRAARLWEGSDATIHLVDGDQLRLAAHSGPITEEAIGSHMPFNRGYFSGRAILEGRQYHVLDGQTEAAEFPGAAARCREHGVHTVLVTPLLREGRGIGTIVIRRTVVEPFDEQQLALVKTFADQAMIAIENVRLFNETKEALERQTATAEILRVIASSPSDVQPVFDAIANSAMRLIGGMSAAVTRVVDGMQHLAAFTTVSKAGDESLKSLFPARIGDLNSGKAITTRAPSMRTDTETDPDISPKSRENARIRGYRSIIAVPMLRDGVAVGAISVTRTQPGPFSSHQVSLLTTFADQAVIAIENVRLFNETKESLEQQTAISEVLRVISASPTDVKPVLDAVAQRAARICNANDARIFLVEQETLRYASGFGDVPMAVALGDAIPLTRGGAMGRAIIDRITVHVEDMQAQSSEEYPAGRRVAGSGGWHTVLAVPLMREKRPLGAIILRRKEVLPFTDKQIALLETFADQAAIAIENVRLFNETKEALDQQKASAGVLRVISSSVADTKPVFDAILDSGHSLFGSMHMGIALVGDDGRLHLGAYHGPAREKMEQFFPLPLNHESGSGSAILQRKILHWPDIENEGVPEYARQGSAITGNRSVIFAPMLWEDKAVGAIFTGRAYAGPFSEKEVSLLKTFADQAVIAIQNARLFNETKEALERQTATGEILNVIASSPSDVQPVFETICKSAARLCDAKDTVLWRIDGQTLRIGGHFGNLPFEELSISAGTVPGRAALNGEVVHVLDLQAEGTEFPEGAKRARRLGLRTTVCVPLMREGKAIGVINARRAEIQPFTDKQISLLKTFADQAVIAIENVRLFNETKESLERQTATAEILKVISASPTDVQPVFDAIVDSAARLFGRKSRIRTIEGGELRLRARSDRGALDDSAEFLTIDRETLGGRIVLERAAMQIGDTHASDAPPLARKFGEKGAYRAMAAAPLLREGTVVGVISVNSPQPGALSDKQMALLQTFADQAVIAIENVRLFKALQERTEALTKSVGQLTALGEVGQTISSTLDLETVLRTIVSHAVQLTGLDVGAIYEYDERAEEFHLRAAENMDEENIEALRKKPIKRGDGAVGRTAVTREPVQVHDIQDESYRGQFRELLLRSGRRALLAVPLMREDHIIGALAVQRNTPGSFAPEIVELLKTFATQSAMAIQNARLFREIAEKGRQLEVASQHKSQFLASMSHELRTPLNALLGFNEMILGDIYGEVPGDMKPPLAQMQSSGKHLLRLINNVLDLAKIEAGRMELALTEYSVQDTVEGVRSTLQPLAADKGLEFLAAVPADIPLAYGDAGRITQCLMNLAGNSLKFTKAGKVEISVAMDNGHLRYRVADTGVGIPPDKIEGLFTEFKQTDATVASEYGGTGLGLSISKKFVEMHGGRIWAESEPGRGSTFTFEIPLRTREGRSA